MPNQKVVIQEVVVGGEDHGYLSEPFNSYEFDETKVEICGSRCHSAPQVHDSFIYYSKPQNMVDSDGLTTLSGISPSSEAVFGGLNPVDNNDTLGLAQPVPRSSGIFMIRNNLAPFSSSREDLAVIPSLTTSEASHEENESDPITFQGPGWATNDIGANVLYQTSSSEEGSVTTVDSEFTPGGSIYNPPTPIPWNNPGLQARWDMPCQESTSQSEPIWLTNPHVPGLNPIDAYNPGAFDGVVAGNHTFHDMSASNSNDARYIVPPVSIPHRPDHSTTNRDQNVKGQGLVQFSKGINRHVEDPYRLCQFEFPKVSGGDGTHFQTDRFDKRQTPSPADTKNAFLIECKRRGLSYKDIKRIGDFKEAESTLRGRFRTLTKTKEQRVRKPQWHEKDIRLLCEAVAICSEPDKPVNPSYGPWYRQRTVTQPPKVSWKKVAQYIWSHGGSYHFGNATCKRKWCEVHNVKI
ncbi:hypothetical protein FE257_007826 [Aspergillus nanangensis]|uniref:Myb-like domain-containing protein n=1 Tax=Aspergillus nanangensis TaxID=2582783 RepID=A0AAD4CXK7_ASPNN|nr:hypothetical protein FE257_007826 [Aspergillus nanangensis]